MRYRIAISRSAVKELGNLPPKTHDKIIEHIRQLEENPRLHGSEKLTGLSTAETKKVTPHTSRPSYGTGCFTLTNGKNYTFTINFANPTTTTSISTSCGTQRRDDPKS